MSHATAAAEAILDGLRATETESDAARRLSDRAVRYLHDPGLTGLLAPAAFGGGQRSPRDLVEAGRLVARASSSAGWVLMTSGANALVVGRMSGQAQDEVFRGDPRALIPGGAARWGTCTRAADGYRVSGRWVFVSAVDHGRWVLVGCRGVPNQERAPCPPIVALIPRQDVEIEDTWFSLGLRGTGSSDVVVDDVFVPRHRAVNMTRAFLGTVPGITIGLYRLPISCTLATLLCAAVVGMAERTRYLFIEQSATRRDAHSGLSKVSTAGVQRRAAEADAEIAHAWGLTEQSCDVLEAAMTAEEPMPVDARGRVRWNAAYAAELCRRATERIYAAAGVGATYDTNELQGVVRDLTTATHHALLDFDTALETQGKLLLGVDQFEPVI
ncbi:MAG: hypothetical protein ACK5PP_20450 [Acidimicrobiales bacterium]